MHLLWLAFVGICAASIALSLLFLRDNLGANYDCSDWNEYGE